MLSNSMLLHLGKKKKRKRARSPEDVKDVCGGCGR